MRINQFVASSSGLSRRAADAAITAGRVSLNGQPASLGASVSAGDTVALDGSIITPRTSHSYVILHKPAGYVSSRARQGADPTLYDLLPKNLHFLRIAGRLDRDSSGLIVLSDDGEFIQALTHPSAEKIKRYQLTLDQPLTPADRRLLEAGVQLTDGPSHVQVEYVNGRSLAVTLGEGRNRQLRRTFGALGYRVDRLHRTQMGTFDLGSLPSGAWRATDRHGAPL